MADEELFADGTQPIAPDPVLPDPLGGLVTGAIYTDPVDILGPITVAPAPVTPVDQQRRRTTATARRTTATRPGAATPQAIPVASSLPSRPVRRAVTQPAQAQAIAPVRGTSARRAAQAGAPGTVNQRRSGAGCAVVVLVFVLLVVFLIVLGMVSGHGAGGFQGG